MISARNILLALAGLIYLGIGYIATTMPHPPLLTILIGFIPLGAAALAAAWKSPARIYLVPLYLICALLIAINLDPLRDHVAWLYFIQHAGAMTLLGLTFGSTLGRRHAEAMCSRIALFIMPGQLDAAYLRYTWQVTLVWTIYFAVSAVLSVLLFFYAPIKVWSAFANLLTPVTLGLMFGGEYLIRQRVLPDGPRFSIAATIKAYRDFTQGPNTP
jgi:uncharacterized membrane protein